MWKLLSFVLLILSSSSITAQAIPENAHNDLYRNGWSCNSGFYKSGNQCLVVEIPEHGQLDVYGSGWACKGGFYKAGNQCLVVEIPEHGQLDVYGSGWACKSGFYKSGNQCLVVEIPEHGKLDVYGSGWVCQSGFYKSANKCVTVQIPEHGQLDVYGSGWVCQSGFYKSGNQCAVVEIPDNAQLNIYGNAWECKSGYKRASNNSCSAMSPTELAAQELQTKSIQAAIKARRTKMLSGTNCDTEDKTGAEVCLHISDATLDCKKSYDGTYYRACDASVSYQLETDYKGRSYLDVAVECEVEIEYRGQNTYSRRSDSNSDRKSHSLYANDSEHGEFDIDFSFSSYQEITQVKIENVTCKITSIELF